MQVSPLDENGKPIDWWFLYKVPKLTKGGAQGLPTSEAAKGYEYVYYDKRAGKVAPSANVLTDGKGALDLTLSSVFQGASSTTGWVLYNDEMPDAAKRSDNGLLGHTKGVIVFDTSTKTAFWLLHSWPKYVDPHEKVLPTPDYGQTYMCLALDLETASRIALQMANHQEPQTYLPNLPASLPKSDPLYKLTQPLDPNAASASETLECKTRGGQAFKVIAKNRKWNDDFWNDLVGPTLKEDMDVETWIRGAIAPTKDNDGVHTVTDIKFIDTRPLGGTWTWPETRDHAKWGITTKSDWICVGDINRMVTQRKRGGGTIAIQDPTLWAALKKTDLIVPPPGKTVADAKAMIKATHKRA